MTGQRSGKKKGRKRIGSNNAADQEQLLELGNTSDTGSNSHMPNNQNNATMTDDTLTTNTMLTNNTVITTTKPQEYINVCIRIMKKLINTKESKLCHKLQKSGKKKVNKVNNNE